MILMIRLLLTGNYEAKYSENISTAEVLREKIALMECRLDLYHQRNFHADYEFCQGDLSSHILLNLLYASNRGKAAYILVVLDTAPLAWHPKSIFTVVALHRNSTLYSRIGQ